MTQAGQTHQVTDGDFRAEVLGAKGYVLVDFWAEWCGPCRALAPVIDELAKEHQGKLEVKKMDIDTNADTPSAYQIRSIPTVMLFKDGQVVERWVGALPKASFDSILARHLK